MRDIKFRGLHGDKMIYGHYFSEPMPNLCYYEAIVCKDESRKYRNHLIEPNTAGQYTGLKDRRGVDIYEGDILDYGFYEDFVTEEPDLDRPMRFAVKWEQSTSSFVANGRLTAYENFGHVYTAGTVIGNIHENPELLS